MGSIILLRASVLLVQVRHPAEVTMPENPTAATFQELTFWFWFFAPLKQPWSTVAGRVISITNRALFLNSPNVNYIPGYANVNHLADQ